MKLISCIKLSRFKVKKYLKTLQKEHFKDKEFQYLNVKGEVEHRNTKQI